ncbi:MAG: hypothetical protein Ct9H300mP1_16950 [Planctomycetaceae bacterium]|nr:MAG: hypothetical protein Ct9H300mP1_16950 [Planctomycetaceae bacterium]
MAWHEQAAESITLLDVMQIYALKTSPAPLKRPCMRACGWPVYVSAYEEMIPSFSRQLGVGFQVLNDLKDWRGDANNKLVAGQDMLAGRPTVISGPGLPGCRRSAAARSCSTCSLPPTSTTRSAWNV